MRHNLFKEVLHQLEGVFIIDQNLVDIAAQVVAQGPDDDVAFLKHQKRRFLLIGRAINGFPQLQQIIQIPLQFFGVFAAARRPDDQAHAFGNFQSPHDFTQIAAGFAFYAPGYAACLGVIGH